MKTYLIILRRGKEARYVYKSAANMDEAERLAVREAPYGWRVASVQLATEVRE